MMAGDTEAVNNRAPLTTVPTLRFGAFRVAKITIIEIGIIRMAVTFVRMAKPVVTARR